VIQDGGGTGDAGRRALRRAPLIFPTDGVAGFLWDDSIPNWPPPGIDIFAGTEPGVTPVIAACRTTCRLPDWKSSVIVRVPSDPLQAGRQIWIITRTWQTATGFVHFAGVSGGDGRSTDRGGTVLGYRRLLGRPNPVGVHLHFSIVESDATGNFKNELEIENTLDPTPYLGLALNARANPETIPQCR
jgi:hypothetical protein